MFNKTFACYVPAHFNPPHSIQGQAFRTSFNTRSTMSEPNHNDSSTASVAPTLTLTVEPNSEWRFELEEGEALAVRLLPPSPPPNLPSDDSEFISDPSPVYIHSQPLPGGATWYPLYGELKSSLWFPYGGDLEICSSLIGEGPAEGKAPSTSYTSTSSILPKVRNLHLALEYRRIMVKRALAMSDSIKSENGTTAPAGEASNQSPSSPLRDSRTWAHRIMVVGPANSGKSTLMKNLVNLTLGSGLNWTPGVVSLDPGDVSFFFVLLTPYLSVHWGPRFVHRTIQGMI